MPEINEPVLMPQSYIAWALIGMAGYSLTSLFVKIAMRAGLTSSQAVALATTVVSLSCWGVVAAKGEFASLSAVIGRTPFWWALATGVVLAVAVSSFFRALELGPASVVVPIYGTFVVGGAVLGVLFLGEPMTWQKLAGIAAAVSGIVLLSL